MKLTTSLAVAANIRELIVQLSRGNADAARSLAARVQGDLNMFLESDSQAASAVTDQAQQTMYAIEEVLTLVGQSNLRGACEAARDAGREWRVSPQLGVGD